VDFEIRAEAVIRIGAQCWPLTGGKIGINQFKIELQYLHANRYGCGAEKRAAQRIHRGFSSLKNQHCIDRVGGGGGRKKIHVNS
jgi:hypothetical protein